MQIASDLAKECRKGDIICLEGELGAGKTRFVKGFAEYFGIEPGSVTSPTFNLIHEYYNENAIPVYHFDCYRLESAEEALDIGAEEYFYGGGVSIIEWPERIAEILPDEIIRVIIRVTGENSRQIEIQFPSET